eukprot:m.385844 g.385844  ORF g.385844 m.385844 type:complete len:75 (+) comp16743_c0_seq11:476-700(+)
MDMYFIVYDGSEQQTQSDNSLKHAKARWKDDKKQYFKSYTCTCGKVVKVGSKPKHLRSLKHKLHTRLDSRFRTP